MFILCSRYVIFFSLSPFLASCERFEIKIDWDTQRSNLTSCLASTNYLESHDRLRLLEFHVLHISFDIEIATGCVVLRPLHVFAIAYQTDVYVPVQLRRDRISEILFTTFLQKMRENPGFRTYVMPCCFSSSLRSVISAGTSSLKTFSFCETCSIARTMSAWFFGIFTLKPSPTGIVFSPTLQLAETLYRQNYIS